MLQLPDRARADHSQGGGDGGAEERAGRVRAQRAGPLGGHALPRPGGNSRGFLDRLTDGLKMSDFGLGMS